MDLIVKVPNERKLNFSDIDQSESVSTYFPSIIEWISKYQMYRQQVYFSELPIISMWNLFIT